MANPRTLDSYCIDEQSSLNIEQGSQSRILIIKDSQQKILVAKTFKLSELNQSDSAFYNEAQILQVLGKHKNIIKMKHFNEKGILRDETQKQLTPYIVLEYCQHGCLFDILQKSRLTEPTARFFFLQILQGLNFCHQKNVFHYDIKPDNILIKQKNGKCVVKIADFGLSYGKVCFTQRGTKSYQNPQMIL